jgi:hypothetical protein
MDTITSEFLDRTGSGRNSYTGNDSLVLNGGSTIAVKGSSKDSFAIASLLVLCARQTPSGSTFGYRFLEWATEGRRWLRRKTAPGV